jgi:hypothetical protein
VGPHLDRDAPATVFGLDVYADTPLALLGSPQASPTGRELHLRVEQALSLDEPQAASVLCDEHKPDGSVNFRIETDPGGGYLIWGPNYGRHLLSADGHRLCCSPSGADSGEWQRLLIAQVLPFAALLQGLEVFHASAVVLDGSALALVGPSGSGKTSLALELCRLGASFLADDVLALEIRDGELLGHPGTPVAGVSRGEARRVAVTSAPALNDSDPHDPALPGTLALHANARELVIATTGAHEPAPLAALFFLNRRADGPELPRFETVSDPQLLLSATFNFVLSTSARLSGLLEVCAIAAGSRVERVLAGPSVDATQLSEAIAQRMHPSRR